MDIGKNRHSKYTLKK